MRRRSGRRARRRPPRPPPGRSSATAALPGPRSGRPHAKRPGCSIGGTAGRVLLRAIIDAGCSGDEFHADSMVCIRKAGGFEDLMPARTRGRASPLAIAAAIDRWRGDGAH